MKKVMVVFFVSAMLFITGCSSKEEILVCTKEQEIDTRTKLESRYQVLSKDGYVTRLDTVEVIISDSEEVLKTYQENLENVYRDYRGINHYSNEIRIEDNKLISTTKVDYDKIDAEQLIKIDRNNATAIENGKVKVSALKETYEQLDAVCKVGK